MGIKLGEIDASQILQNEFRIEVLDGLLLWIANNNPELNAPTPEMVNKLRQDVILRMQRKYPNSGIRYQGEER